MSGHSHFKTIKAQKELADAKRGKIFSKLSRLITIAAKEGENPDFNPKLKAAIEQAKQFNMPKENIERAIKKGTGELEGEKLQEILFEGFGPGGVAIIIEGITDNVNRTLNEIKMIFNQFNGKLAGEGAVKWMFDRKGIISASCQNKPKDEIELAIIEAGAEDFYWENESIEIYTKPEELEKIKKNLQEKNFKIESAALGYKAKEEVDVLPKEREQIQKLFEALGENDAVNEIYSNLKV